ncbi:glutathione S-transferase [Tardiphaga robiniae]|nr:glutathione S-transferase [Tardiphaga robiniae]
MSGLEWRARFVDFFDEQTRGSFKNAVSDMGELPVLRTRTLTVSQSGVILTYLSKLTGKFGGRDDTEKLEILRWILFDNHRFTPNYASLRFMIGIRKIEENAVTQFLRSQTMAAFDVVEARLSDRPFIVGERPTIADISMVGYQFYDEATGIDRDKYPNLLAWLDRMSKLPGWAHPYDLMPRALRGTGPAHGPDPETSVRWP